MLRRREMVLPSDDGFLKFDTMAVNHGTASPYWSVETSRGNHFNVYLYRRAINTSTGPYISLHEIANAWNAEWPEIMQYTPGDFIEFYLKNYNVTTHGTDGGGPCKFDFRFVKAGNGSNAFGPSTASASFTIPEVGPAEDLYYSVTAAGTNAANCVRIYGRNTANQYMRCRFEFDLELYVNGERII